MTNREMETINNIIREKTYCDEEIPGSGSFTYQLYADYRDELDDANIKQIFNSCDPKEEFLDLLMQGYDDAMWEDECEIVSTIMANLEETDVELDEDEIRQYVQENVCIELPEDHYLSQQVNINIYLDTGDANYDFTLNTFGQCYYGDPEEPIDDKASLVWLAKTQGYTKEDLYNAVYSEDKIESKFLSSVRRECANIVSSINALVFCVRMSLEDALTLNSVFEKPHSIILNTGVTCGLYDSWSGGGSTMEIELEKPISIPLDIIHTALPDGCNEHYSIKNCYGVCDSFWTDGCYSLVYDTPKEDIA